jgi:hypothetical protein
LGFQANGGSCIGASTSAHLPELKKPLRAFGTVCRMIDPRIG